MTNAAILLVAVAAAIDETASVNERPGMEPTPLVDESQPHRRVVLVVIGVPVVLLVHPVGREKAGEQSSQIEHTEQGEGKQSAASAPQGLRGQTERARRCPPQRPGASTHRAPAHLTETLGSEAASRTSATRLPRTRRTEPITRVAITT